MRVRVLALVRVRVLVLVDVGAFPVRVRVVHRAFMCVSFVCVCPIAMMYAGP